MKPFTPYCSFTGTRTTKAALQRAGWRFFITPQIWDRNGRCPPTWNDNTPAGYALDNGAWGCHNSGREFDAPLFMRTYESIGAGADFVCVPDVVADRAASLKKTEKYLPLLAGATLLLIVLQDGFVEEDVAPWIGPKTGIAVGGTTEWKLKTLPKWSSFSKKHGCYLHVLRANSAKRIWLSRGLGADSFDGTSVTLFPSTLPHLQNALSQADLFGG